VARRLHSRQVAAGVVAPDQTIRSTACVSWQKSLVFVMRSSPELSVSYLSAARPHHHLNAAQSHSAASPDESTPALILVVDDEPHILDFLSLLLEDEGYRVRQASNGLEAISAMQEESPQLVISDVMMPVINGVELVRQIDRSEREPLPKVILMSAVNQRTPKPGVPFIQKPFDINDMLAMIDGVLDEDAPRSA
jgi:CheY-like chemotaxis protein